MPLRLYELAAADPARVFSPHCWKSRFALAHKGLVAETVPWHFTQKEAIAFSGQGRVPVLVDEKRIVHDSWLIAEYLEQAYPDRPSLFGGAAGHALAKFVSSWTDTVVISGLITLVVSDIWQILREEDKAYFRESREARFGKPLEEVTADRDNRVKGFRASLAPLRTMLKAQPYIGGESPLYADYCVAASFVWARNVSNFQVLEADDPISDWRQRLLDAFDGLGRSVPALDAAA